MSHCLNCGHAFCPQIYSSQCWRIKYELLVVQVQALEAAEAQHSDRVAHPDLSTNERLSLLEQWYQGALRAARDPDPRPHLPLRNSILQENLGFLLLLARQALTPVSLAALYCPVCKTRHIDEGEFGSKIHHTHACQGFVEDNGKRRRCGHVWRPAKVATVGVEALPGYLNEPDALK